MLAVQRLVTVYKSGWKGRLLLRDVIAMLRGREGKEMGSSDAISVIPAARTAKAASSMTTLTKSQCSKAFPAAKVVILERYTLPEVPKMSDIGTMVRSALRQAMLAELRRGENDDVADYLATHEVFARRSR